jgi:hypothetical protein
MTSEPPLRAAAAKVSATQNASFVLGFGGKLPAGHSTLLAQIVGQRQCDDCRDSTHADQNRVEAVTATGGIHPGPRPRTQTRALRKHGRLPMSDDPLQNPGFVTSGDGHGGTLVSEAAQASSQHPLPTHPQAI